MKMVHAMIVYVQFAILTTSISTASAKQLSTKDVVVFCLPDKIKVVIARKKIDERGVKFHFEDQTCITKGNSTHIIASVSHYSCGTTKIHSEDSTRYENSLKRIIQTVDSRHTISRCPYQTIKVACKYPHFKVGSRLPRSANQIEAEKVVTCSNVVGLGKPKEDGVIQKALLSSEQAISSQSKTITCPHMIGIGQELAPDRALTYTNVIFPLKIAVDRSIVTCRPLENDGIYDTQMTVYTDESYRKVQYTPVKITDFNERIYYEVSIYSENENLRSTPYLCYATPVEDHNSKKRYVFLKDGCPIDATFKTHPPKSKSQNRFSIQSFKFLHTKSNTIYVHCNVMICDQFGPCEKDCKQQDQSKENELLLQRKKRSTAVTRNKVSFTYNMDKNFGKRFRYTMKTRRYFYFKIHNKLTTIVKINVPKSIIKRYQGSPVEITSRRDGSMLELEVKTIDNNVKAYLNDCYYGQSRLRRKQMQIIQNGCSKKLIKVEESNNQTSQIIRFNLKKGLFNLKSYISYLTCHVKVCTSNKHECKRSCDVSKRRKRRSASNNKPEVTLACHSKSMIIAVKKPIPGNVDVNKLHLLDPLCKAVENSTHIILATETNSCGTSFQRKKHFAKYSNALLEEAPEGLIIRRHLLKIPFTCTYKANLLSQAILVRLEHSPVVEFRSRAFGTYNVAIVLYNDYTFQTPSTENNAEIASNKDMFFEVKVTSPQLKLDLFLDECFGYPSGRLDEREEYVFIKNGCGIDGTLKFYPTDIYGKIRFSMKPFMFNDRTSTIMINCYVTACNVQEENSKCKRGCQN